MENNKTIVKGASFVSLLTLAFIVLKLTGVISWAWVWVVSPIWISLIIDIIVIAVCLWILKS